MVVVRGMYRLLRSLCGAAVVVRLLLRLCELLQVQLAWEEREFHYSLALALQQAQDYQAAHLAATQQPSLLLFDAHSLQALVKAFPCQTQAVRAQQPARQRRWPSSARVDATCTARTVRHRLRLTCLSACFTTRLDESAEEGQGMEV